MGEEYLVRGATLRCTMGTATSKLNLPVCHGVYCTGKPMMHMMDYIPMVNIMPFGSCVVLQGAPCVPVTVPWMIPNMTFHLTGHIPAITTKSFCVCLLGGMISPQDSGQGVIQVKLNGPVERAGAKGSNKTSSEDSEDLLTYEEKNAKVDYGDHYTKDEKHRKSLKPNITYVTPDPDNFEYKTDDKGRIVSVKGTLTNIDGAKRNEYAQRTVGREDRIKSNNLNEDEKNIYSGDDGGHLIGSRFGGSGNLDNLVPMDSNLNRGAWERMENEWSKAIKEGKKVEVDIKPIYEDDLLRPTSFSVIYKIEGKKTMTKTFLNQRQKT